jgi:hypothetical protein
MPAVAADLPTVATSTPIWAALESWEVGMALISTGYLINVSPEVLEV